MTKRVRIIVGIVVLLAIGFIWIISNIEDKKKWYDDLDYYTATMLFLKRQIEYPNTFEYVDYPSAEFGTEENKEIEVSGRFKCANSLGIYNTYHYVIRFEVKKDWVVKYYLIA